MVKPTSRTQNEKIIFRKDQFSLLHQILDPDVTRSIFSFVHCFGCQSTGKRTTIIQVLTSLEAPYVMVDCTEACGTPKLLFEAILNSLENSYSADQKSTQKKKFENRIRCDNASCFVSELSALIQRKRWTGKVVVIVFKSAERLREMPAHTLAFFGKIRELICHNVSVVTVSELPYSKFYCLPAGFAQPVQIYFPNYSREELVEILRQSAPPGSTEDVYRAYCDSLTQVFFPYCRNLREFQYLADKIWMNIVEKLSHDNEDVAPTDFRQMWKELKPQIALAHDSLFLRALPRPCLPTEQLTDTDFVIDSLKPNNNFDKKLTRNTVLIEMPKFRKVVLVATYLASYNQPKFDERFFYKSHKKQKKLKSVANMRKEGKSAHVCGPRPFTLPRILPICRHIMKELEISTSSEMNIRTQIASLVSSSMVSKTSAGGNLEVPKFRCIANFDTVNATAESMNFQLINYLQDFMY